MTQDPPPTPFWKDFLLFIVGMVLFFCLCYSLAWVGCDLLDTANHLEGLGFIWVCGEQS